MVENKSKPSLFRHVQNIHNIYITYEEKQLYNTLATCLYNIVMSSFMIYFFCIKSFGKFCYYLSVECHGPIAYQNAVSMVVDI